MPNICRENQLALMLRKYVVVHQNIDKWNCRGAGHKFNEYNIIKCSSEYCKLDCTSELLPCWTQSLHVTLLNISFKTSMASLARMVLRLSF